MNASRYYSCSWNTSQCEEVEEVLTLLYRLRTLIPFRVLILTRNPSFIFVLIIYSKGKYFSSKCLRMHRSLTRSTVIVFVRNRVTFQIAVNHREQLAFVPLSLRLLAFNTLCLFQDVFPLQGAHCSRKCALQLEMGHGLRLKILETA